jgi:hypothetical protein
VIGMVAMVLARSGLGGVGIAGGVEAAS